MNNKKLYRNELLKTAYDAAGWSARTFQAKHGIAAETQKSALNGESMQLQKLRDFTDALSVDWSELFNFEGKK